MQEPLVLRKRIVAGLLALLVLVAAILVIRFLQTGKLVVQASSGAVITLRKTDGTVVKQSTGVLRARLRHGTYAVSVQGSVLATNFSVTVPSLGSVYKKVGLPAAGAPVEPVASTAAQGIDADAGTLRYLDTDDATLRTTGTDNDPTLSGSDQSLSSIAWSAQAGSGVAQTDDGHILRIQDGNLLQLPTPAAYGEQKSVAYALTPDNHLYVSIDRQLYYGSVGSDLQLIYTAGAVITNLSASNTGIAVGTLNQTKGGSSPDPKLLLTLVLSNGQKIASREFPYNDNQDAPFIASWSPDGNLIAVSNGSEASAIFDTDFKQRYDIPNQDITGLTWQNKTTLYLATGNLLWKYSIGGDTSQSAVIANAGNGSVLSDLTVSRDGAYTYFNDSPSDDSGDFLARVNLKGTVPSDSTLQLHAFFPTSGDCAIDYMNFTAATLLVSGDAPTCTGAVANELVQDGLDGSNFAAIYSFNPATPEE